MLSISDAHRLIETHLGDTPRAEHSLLVGSLMRGLAHRLDDDPLLWQLTGICHDLDVEAVAGDWTRHGLLAAEWLKDDLSPAALEAIRAHDHRTGVVSVTPIAHALKLADAIAIARDHIGPHLLLRLAAGDYPEIARRLDDRPYLPALLAANAASLGVSLPALAPILAAAALVIDAITPDTAGFADLRQHCTAEGHRMLQRFEEGWLNGSNRFDQPGERALGAVLDGNLVAICGRNRDPYEPSPRAGRVRHLYVDLRYRRLGIGRHLVEAVLDGAAAWFDYLNTNCPPEAAAFYERLGFVPYVAERHPTAQSQPSEGAVLSLFLLPWLFTTALLGQSDLGLLGIAVAVAGLAGLVLALAATVRDPSLPLLWLLLPLAVPHVFLQVVGIWLIGDHHETVALSLYAIALLAALGIAIYAARANPLAVGGTVVFTLAYAWIAFEASLFVFWNGLH